MCKNKGVGVVDRPSSRAIFKGFSSMQKYESNC